MPWTVKDVDKHKKGLSDKQKKKWVQVANSVRADCLRKGGDEKTCDAKAIRIANGVTTSNKDFSLSNLLQMSEYSVKRYTYQGRTHMIVPVVMMVEGVHTGSAGPLYHTKEELAKFPEAWNGIPVVINHPEINGIPISANEPEVLESPKTVGRVFNVRYENGKLKGEAWIDEEKLKIASPETYKTLSQGSPLEVSVGVFTDEEKVEGEWNGETYKAIARNYRPDHLALLPFDKGACSWEDGCGIRVNKSKEGLNVELNVSDLLKQGLLVHRVKTGFLETADKIQSLLSSKSDGMTRYYLQEVFPDSVVYEVYTDGKQSKLVQRKYKILDDGTIEFNGDPQEVNRKVQYIPIKANSEGNKFVRTNKGGKDMSCCPDKVKILVQSGIFSDSEEDMKIIESLGEERIDKLIAYGQSQNKEGKKVTKEELLKALKEQEVSYDDVKDFLPEDVKSKVEEGLKIHADHRAKLIKTITDNSKEFKEDELKEFKTDFLEKLAKTVDKPVDNTDTNNDVTDYSLAGAGVQANSGADEVLIPPVMQINKESK